MHAFQLTETLLHAVHNTIHSVDLQTPTLQHLIFIMILYAWIPTAKHSSCGWHINFIIKHIPPAWQGGGGKGEGPSGYVPVTDTSAESARHMTNTRQLRRHTFCLHHCLFNWVCQWNRQDSKTTPEEGIIAETLYSCLSIFCSSVHKIWLRQ